MIFTSVRQVTVKTAISMNLDLQRPMNSPISPVNVRKSNAQWPGYVRLEMKGCQAVARDWAASAVVNALRCGTLHEWAAGQPVTEEMRGRGVIYSVDLPTVPATPVVIRRNRHGGLMGNVTGEYFLSPTRAPLELATSLRLAAAGIATPEVIAYALYPVVGIFARSDIMTRRLPEGDDAPAAWKKGSASDHSAILRAIAGLLKALADAGAWHADLNLKNIYIADSDENLTAYLLDVDRVTFPLEGNVAERNFTRLARSVRKWRARWGLDFDEDSLVQLAAYIQENR